jgi:hypothetical protein
MSRYSGGEGLFGASEIATRGVIKLAPDVMVTINGALGSTVLEPVTGQDGKIDFQQGITSVSIQNNVEPPGSSTANIEIATPIYDERSKYWVNFAGEHGRDFKVPYFVPMMEVQVFFKGRFLVNGQSKYYPAFWGFITNVEETYSGGLYKISLQCADMLHWWQYILVTFRPSVATDVFTAGGQGLTVFGSRYYTANAFEIIYALTRQMGFENFFTPDWVAKLPGQSAVNISPRVYRQIYKEIYTYWIEKFSKIGNLLKMYGATGNLIYNPRQPVKQEPTDTIINENKNTTDRKKKADANPTAFKFGMDDDYVKNFQVFNEFALMSKSLADAEYMTKLEIATELKNRVNYEFYQDVNGSLIFKPPFYNLDVRTMMPYRIKSNDILSFSSSVNSDEIITCLEVQTSIHQQIRDESWVNKVGYHIDIELNKQFGHRYRKENCWWLSGTNLAQSYAVGRMSQINAKCYLGSVTIPGRPELRLGYPVYIEHKDAFFYVKSINHSFDYGGSFTTALSLEAKRQKIYDQNKDTKNWEPQKYKVYMLTGKVTKLLDDKGDKQKTIAEDNQVDQSDGEKKFFEIIRGSDMAASVEPGIYEVMDQEKAAKQLADEQAQAPKNAKDKKKTTAPVIPTAPYLSTIRDKTVPYTDEFGYRVIGGLRYGRGIIVQAGTIFDGPEIKASEELTQGDIVTKTQAQMLMESATDESVYMKEYFTNSVYADSTGIKRPIEGLVPGPLKFAYESLSQKPSTASQANQIANMIALSPTTLPNVTLVNKVGQPGS